MNTTPERLPITWAENAQPTPAEFAEWFVANPPTARVEIAEQVLRNGDRAHDCFVQGHDMLRQELQRLTTPAREEKWTDGERTAYVIVQRDETVRVSYQYLAELLTYTGLRLDKSEDL